MMKASGSAFALELTLDGRPVAVLNYDEFGFVIDLPRGTAVGWTGFPDVAAALEMECGGLRSWSGRPHAAARRSPCLERGVVSSIK